ncbi:hypothetical protein KP806_13850 [Paenibacillus sp. N4]|uniref:hypothetical protein n=1 Tax=Paenibacillus vietnamensis TaxID=2590547 RepID=UPI001CD0E93A|nr:hypothetical protein [Paenibacillus vietnamensis]MCA0756135.1 hypothetical protein [Paenibacillus vietnamensis]
MVKGLTTLGVYLMKTQTLFLVLPIAVCLISVGLRSHDTAASVQFLAMLGPLTVVFPAAAINGPMGSLHQKELFVSLPVSPLSFGVVQPVLSFTFYGVLLSAAYLACVPNSWTNDSSLSAAGALFVSAIALFALTCLLINLLKNAAIGMVLALIYMIFGMFTTGTGQGPFYLFQWFRPRPLTGPDEYIAVQLAGTAVLLAVNFAVIKYRTKLQFLPY